MNDIKVLCCSSAFSSGRVHEMLNCMGGVVKKYGEELINNFKSASSEQKTMYGSYLARKFLEASYTSMLMKVDPIRFLVLHTRQNNGNYDLGIRHESSISWSVDFVPSKSVNTETEVSPDKFGRALLGGHLAEEVFFRAIEAVDSAYANGKPEFVERVIRPWYDDYGNLRKRSDILAIYRQRSQSLFSSLSKGVHLEFVIDEGVKLDDLLVDEKSEEAFILVASVGFILSFSDVVVPAITKDQAEILLQNVFDKVSGND